MSRGIAVKAVLRRNLDEIRAEFLNYSFRLKIPYQDYKNFWLVDIIFAERAEILEPTNRKELLPQNLSYPLYIQEELHIC